MHVQCLHGSNYAKEFSNKEKKLKYKMYQNVNFTYTFSLFTSDIRQKNETRCNEICFLSGQEKKIKGQWSKEQDSGFKCCLQ